VHCNFMPVVFAGKKIPYACGTQFHDVA